MLNKTILMLVLFIGTTTWANEYSYRADVKGMVCAFCAYSVSKNISALPGVDALSVDVDLKGGRVTFHSSQIVSEDKLAAVFADSGFVISNMKQSKLNTTVSKPENTTAALVLEVNLAKVEQYSSVLEAIGNIAASAPYRLIIRAPAADEDKLLKPLLLGRQQVIKVHYISEKTERVHIELFSGLTEAVNN